MAIYEFDVAIIGAGPAGLAAAVAAKDAGAERVVLIERDFRVGGILEQCIHTGFGLKYFGEQLSGPEYSGRFAQRVRERDITVMLDTMVLSVEGDKRIIHAVNKEGTHQIHAGAIILSMGCRERTRAQVMTPGSRPAGVFTAGTAQRFINVQNCLVGKRAVIVGSGDIGMIMSRRLTLEGTEVVAVVEIMPYLAGLTRNKVQCLDDFGIPLYLSHTITNIRGQKRVEGVDVARLDENKQIIPGSEFSIDCDTLLFSVGLIPENEVSKTAGVRLDSVTNGPVVDNNMQTNVTGIFACGNVLHVNDLVDNVSAESERAGRCAALYAMGKLPGEARSIKVVAGSNVRYVTPQTIVGNSKENVRVYFRVGAPDQGVATTATAGETECARKRRPFVNPGEIESLDINVAKLLESGANEVIVNCAR